MGILKKQRSYMLNLKHLLHRKIWKNGREGKGRRQILRKEEQENKNKRNKIRKEKIKNIYLTPYKYNVQHNN